MTSYGPKSPPTTPMTTQRCAGLSSLLVTPVAIGGPVTIMAIHSNTGPHHGPVEQHRGPVMIQEHCHDRGVVSPLQSDPGSCRDMESLQNMSSCCDNPCRDMGPPPHIMGH